VNVSVETHPELAVAMRGGGNQYGECRPSSGNMTPTAHNGAVVDSKDDGTTGIVTCFTVKTYPIGRVWGGIRFYSRSKQDELFDAILRFTVESATEDPKAAMAPGDCFTYKGHGFIMCFLFYDGEKPTKTGAFGELLKIPCMLDLTRTTTYVRLVSTSMPRQLGR
jgi:hypothetical protein